MDDRDDPEEPNVVALTPEEERNLRAHLAEVAERVAGWDENQRAWSFGK
jgi:hypothetical protein